MLNKKFVMPILLIFALSMISLAYAHWSQTIYVDGSVESGTLDWHVVDASCLDTDGRDYNCRDEFAGPYPLFWRVDKDVGRSSVEITDPHTVTVTLENVYPSYFTTVSIYAHNTGTIPLIIDSIIIGETAFRKTIPRAYVKLDLNGDGLYDIEIWWRNALGTQLHPCEDSDEMSFWIHVLQDAPQGATLRFTMRLVAIQWNMYVPP